MRPSRPCPACFSDGDNASLRLPEMMFGLREEFEYRQCAQCTTLYIAEVPHDLGDYYSTKYYSFDLDPEAVMGRPGVAQAVGALGRSIIFGRNRIAPFARRIPVRQLHTTIALFDTVRLAGLPKGRSSAVLDVGCGSGALVYALSLAGIRSVTGVDPFNPSDRHFRTGAKVLTRRLEDVEGKFDLVMLHHSLEHVPDPRATLVAARARLADGGRVLVRMPTVSSEAWERYGQSWMQLDPPRHLTVFSRQGLKLAAADAGLRIVAEVDDSTSFQFWASEQARAGVPLVADNSHFLHPDRSAFTAAQIRSWELEARALNAQGRGDQVAWVLEAS